MTEINEHHGEQFYDGDRKVFDVSVDIEADANRNQETALDAVERIRNAVRKEAQAIQDELDTEGAIDGDG